MIDGKTKRAAVWRYNAYIGSIHFALGALRPFFALSSEAKQQAAVVLKELHILRSIVNRREYSWKEKSCNFNAAVLAALLDSQLQLNKREPTSFVLAPLLATERPCNPAATARRE